MREMNEGYERYDASRRVKPVVVGCGGGAELATKVGEGVCGESVWSCPMMRSGMWSMWSPPCGLKANERMANESIT